MGGDRQARVVRGGSLAEICEARQGGGGGGGGGGGRDLRTPLVPCPTQVVCRGTHRCNSDLRPQCSVTRSVGLRQSLRQRLRVRVGIGRGLGLNERAGARRAAKAREVESKIIGRPSPGLAAPRRRARMPAAGAAGGAWGGARERGSERARKGGSQSLGWVRDGQSKQAGRRVECARASTPAHCALMPSSVVRTRRATARQRSLPPSPSPSLSLPPS